MEPNYENLNQRLKQDAEKRSYCDTTNQASPQAPPQGFGVAAQQYSPETWARELFIFRSPTIDQVANMDAIRDAAAHLALVMIRNAPQYAPEFSQAIENLRVAVMFANQAIVKR